VVEETTLVLDQRVPHNELIDLTEDHDLTVLDLNELRKEELLAKVPSRKIESPLVK